MKLNLHLFTSALLQYKVGYHTYLCMRYVEHINVSYNFKWPYTSESGMDTEEERLIREEAVLEGHLTVGFWRRSSRSSFFSNIIPQDLGLLHPGCPTGVEVAQQRWRREAWICQRKHRWSHPVLILLSHIPFIALKHPVIGIVKERA